MIYNDRLGDQTDQNEYDENSNIGNLSELNSELFLDDYKSVDNNNSRKTDQQMGLIQLENVNNYNIDINNLLTIILKFFYLYIHLFCSI